MKHGLHLLATSPVHRARLAATLSAVARSCTAGMRWWWRRVAWETQRDPAGEVGRLHAENRRLRAQLAAERGNVAPTNRMATARGERH